MNDQEDTPEARRTMRYWLARTLRHARERAKGVRTKDIATLADVDVSTVTRFERGETWPRELDQLIAAYAAYCGVEDGRDLWQQALKDWKANGGAPALGELTHAQRALLLALEATQRPTPHGDESQETPNTTPRKRRSS